MDAGSRGKDTCAMNLGPAQPAPPLPHTPASYLSKGTAHIAVCSYKMPKW